ncbi:MAG: LOG family protein [Phycisphaerae bacterium]
MHDANQSAGGRLSDPAQDEARKQREKDIQAFAERHLAGENQDLYQELMVTLCRMARDQADRGDVKLVNRAMAELRYALKIFAPYQHTRKISIFGSSRTPESHADYQAAVRFASLMREAGWMVITGAGDGIMKAGHGGAGRQASFGVAIRLPFEQRTNEIIADDPKLVNFRYFFTRKLMFVKEASAVALFPGGFGTQDEGFEVLTLVQTGKAELVPLVMVERPGGTYWRQWHAYVATQLLRNNMISEQDLSLFRIADSVEAAVEDIVTFYRVYHSQRYVGDDLLLRLNTPLPPAFIDRLNGEYAPRITLGGAGRIEQVAALPEEGAEEPGKPRLRIPFDKRSFGRLRRMIDAINRFDQPAATVPVAE